MNRLIDVAYLNDSLSHKVVLTLNMQHLSRFKEGGDGTVFHDRKEDTIVKIHDDPRDSLSEYFKLRSLSGVDGIVRYKRFRFIHGNNGERSGGIELVKYDGDCYTDILDLPDDTKIDILYQIVRALCQLHSRGLCHGDVKANNVLFKRVKDKDQDKDVSAFEIVLCDLGNTALSGRVISEYSTIPNRYGKIYSYGSDLYSLIVVVLDFYGYGIDSHNCWRIRVQGVDESDIVKIVNPTCLKLIRYCFNSQIDNTAMDLLKHVWDETFDTSSIRSFEYMIHEDFIDSKANRMYELDSSISLDDYKFIISKIVESINGRAGVNYSRIGRNDGEFHWKEEDIVKIIESPELYT